MLRLVPVAAVVATSLSLLGATAGYAQSRSYYVATALEAPAKANFVTRSTAWSCDGAVCTAARAPERDVFVCERVASSVGPLAAFAAGGTALDADALAKCNAKAK
ncbi:hypothetical protein ACFO8O_05635 [Hephaestia sp. GCM10023244]|uniref:CC_3452 family protein n=1 Tax=unclassified Hephaestia TaxID=2631281 RepID=UPI0020778254|nr:hypothetical protein [Hephaestia sp. MAHUQ-44]MCM8730449.1 hypothetical protein [Hephaestia sp. MAHUQ-44]